MIRYCEACDEEFQPHMAKCSDCGAELVDRSEDEPQQKAEVHEEPAAMPADHRVVLGGIEPSLADRIGRRLEARDIEFRLGVAAAGGGTRGTGLQLSVKADQAAAARTVLVRMGAIPPQPGGDDVAVAAAGGTCPACGSTVEAGSKDCADCGLSLGADAEACERCGADIPSGEGCPDCRL